jgi:hypothetical protein
MHHLSLSGTFIASLVTVFLSANPVRVAERIEKKDDDVARREAGDEAALTTD